MPSPMACMPAGRRRYVEPSYSCPDKYLHPRPLLLQGQAGGVTLLLFSPFLGCSFVCFAADYPLPLTLRLPGSIIQARASGTEEVLGVGGEGVGLRR